MPFRVRKLTSCVNLTCCVPLDLLWFSSYTSLQSTLPAIKRWMTAGYSKLQQAHRRSTGYTVGQPGDLMCQVHTVGPSRTQEGPPGFYPFSRYRDLYIAIIHIAMMWVKGSTVFQNGSTLFSDVLNYLQKAVAAKAVITIWFICFIMAMVFSDIPSRECLLSSSRSRAYLRVKVLATRIVMLEKCLWTYFIQSGLGTIPHPYWVQILCLILECHC